MRCGSRRVARRRRCTSRRTARCSSEAELMTTTTISREPAPGSSPRRPHVPSPSATSRSGAQSSHEGGRCHEASRCSDRGRGSRGRGERVGRHRTAEPRRRTGDTRASSEGRLASARGRRGAPSPPFFSSSTTRMRISSEYSGRTRRRSLTSLSENRQLPRRSAPGIIAAEVHALNEVATTFLTLGAVSYGGAGVLGMMQAEIQQKRGWLSTERFLEGLALSTLLPGPTAAQLAMFLGYARAGWMGALVAGVCFVVPRFVVMLTLTLLYTTFAAVSTLRGSVVSSPSPRKSFGS